MDCDAAADRLPWLLNGSLSAGEAAQVGDHLAGCPRCRNEMEETRRAAAVFGAHLPTDAILDLAWDRAVPGLDAGLARRHLDDCADCQDELDLARESRRLESAPVAAPLPRKQAAWPLFALPATLAAGLVMGILWGRPDRTAGPSSGPPDRDRIRASALEEEVARLRSMVAGMENAVQNARLPRVNLPVFEVLPGRLLRGEADGPGNQVTVPAGATEVALLLSADGPAGGKAALVIQRSDGTEIWRGDGLEYGPPGGYVVALPAELLGDGNYVLTIRPHGAGAVAYRIHVRHAR